MRAYIVCVFYAAIANAFTQGHLPSLADLTTDDPIKRLVDQSNADFQILEALIAGYETREVQSCPIRNLYDDALRWKPVVRDSAMVYQTRQREA